MRILIDQDVKEDICIWTLTAVQIDSLFRDTSRNWSIFLRNQLTHDTALPVPWVSCSETYRITKGRNKLFICADGSV